jgi:hypothetical protein
MRGGKGVASVVRMGAALVLRRWLQDFGGGWFPVWLKNRQLFTNVNAESMLRRLIPHTDYVVITNKIQQGSDICPEINI